MSQPHSSPTLQAPSGISFQPNPTTSKMAREPGRVSMQQSACQQGGEEQRLELAWRWQGTNQKTGGTGTLISELRSQVLTQRVVQCQHGLQILCWGNTLPIPAIGRESKVEEQ